ncbi:hypothetical protein U5922_008015 [Aquicoccus sp. G2-2]|uniref:hypothetical protein n=1 Tax=Aquicoccus sp. G2-2 TaxID=3092120 RepID=UPI002ADF78CD|nr:hypothetical protein [Aquicoccus sp. G2-2]MEA1113420.1 hypothetical protein [Aquicoccus sp. G2-2]
MQHGLSALTPEIFLRDLFASKAVQQGQVIRRKARDIERIIGFDALIDELRKRGFRAVENNGQIVIFCNRAPIRPLI